MTKPNPHSPLTTAHSPLPDHLICMFPGVAFDPFCPDVGTLSIEGIAHGLAGTFRFGGQSDRWYTVAQHSVAVSLRVGANPNTSLWGLLHDAAEAPMFDVPRPIKGRLYLREPGGTMTPFQKIERRILAAVAERFGLAWHGLPAAVVEADDRELMRERRDLFVTEPWWPPFPGVEPYSEPIEYCWSPQHAEKEFLDRFFELRAERRKKAETTDNAKDTVPSVRDRTAYVGPLDPFVDQRLKKGRSSNYE